MITREFLVNRLLYLIPNAKFLCWPDERQSEDDPIDNKGYTDIILFEKWVIHWCQENTAEFPGWDSINAVTDKQLADKAAYDKKQARNKEMAANLAVVSNYRAYAALNPGISFSAYLDMLEDIDLGV